MIAARAFRFFARLVNVMTVIAQALPVRTVPELHHVTAMRNDVIDQRCQPGATITQLDAPRVHSQVRLTLLAPAVIVSTLMRRAAIHGALHRLRNARWNRLQGFRRRRSRATKLSTVCLVR